VSSDYTTGIEKQNEELQQRLALSEFEAEEYKKILDSRKGIFVVVQDALSLNFRLSDVADVVLKPIGKKMSGEWEYEVIKDRTGRFGEIYNLDQIRDKARNFWQ
jgi:hypothetical protein